MKNKIKVLFVYLLGFFGILVGKIIILLKGQKYYNNNKFKEIIFNRTDRIGDAIISRNFFDLTIKFLKEKKISSNYKILVSSYNSFIFDCNNKNYKLEKIEKELSDNYNLIGLLIKNIRLVFLQNLYKLFNGYFNGIKNKLLIDFVGDPYIIEKYKKNSIIIGPNLFLNSFLVDYNLKYSYVSLKSQNLIESYIDLIEGYFSFKGDFRNYIYKNLDQYIGEYNIKYKKNTILIFIGNKNYRNFTKEKWLEIINYFGNNFENFKIEIIDDNNNFLYNKLKDYQFNKNIKLIKNIFSLEEFKEYAKIFELLIGIDGGGFNYIRTIRNSITLYTLGNPEVWKIFSGKNKYKCKKINKNYYMSLVNINGKKYSYIYKKNLFLPSYDISLGKDFFSDFPIDFIKSDRS